MFSWPQVFETWGPSFITGALAGVFAGLISGKLLNREQRRLAAEDRDRNHLRYLLIALDKLSHSMGSFYDKVAEMETRRECLALQLEKYSEIRDETKHLLCQYRHCEGNVHKQKEYGLENAISNLIERVEEALSAGDGNKDRDLLPIYVPP